MSLKDGDNTPFLFKGERIENLNSKGLRIIQSSNAPCFSLDALLLADFACNALALEEKREINLGDLGSGTGVIALLAAYHLPNSRVFALELMPEMADMACRSVALNALDGRVKIIQGDIKKADAYFEEQSFDAIISNPPYEKAGQGRISPSPLKAAAKGEIFCSLENVVSAAFDLLKPGGSFFISHRPKRLEEALSLFKKYGIGPKDLRFIYPYAHLPAKHLLLQGIKGANCELTVLPPLIVYQTQGSYTSEGERILSCPLKGEGEFEQLKPE